VDTRLTSEQAALRDTARRLARDLGPTTVAALDDSTRAKRLAGALRDTGWLELRHDAGGGAPLASGVEAAIVAEALGAGVADVAFSGPLLAADLARRAGVVASDGTAVAYRADLTGVGAAGLLAVVDAGAEPERAAFVVLPETDGYRLGTVALGDDVGPRTGSDLTRRVRTFDARGEAAPVPSSRVLADDDLAAWTALGLALMCADLVGVMRGVLDVTVAYARERRQFGVPVGSFQAVQHLLADAHCLLEGSTSVAQHAAWAVDDLPPGDALHAGRVAKAYCARAARTVCETAIQVHGGIGNTWECIVHVYLRRALLSSQWFGDDGEQLHRLQGELFGAA
jgi:alkylation response protein AidB-like acyl-CoA dehydrogenase